MMRLNLLDYDLSAVSGRGTTTVSQINEGLSRVAESLAIVWISIHKDAAKLDGVQNRIEQYIALDHYSKIVPNSLIRWPWVAFDKLCYWQNTTNGTLVGSADAVYFPSSTAVKNFVFLDCCAGGRIFDAEQKTAKSYIAYTPSDMDILWRMQDDSKSSAVLERNILTQIQTQGSSAPSVSDLSKIIEIVDELIKHQFFDGISRVFEQIDLSAIHPAHMIALLRTTGINRSKILGWQAFRDNVRQRLEEMHVNVSKVMRGLI